MHFTCERITHGSDQYGGIVDYAWNPQFAATLNAGGSLLDAIHRAVHSADPMLSITTVDVDVWLRAVFHVSGTTPLIPHLAVATTGDPLVLYLQSVDGATRGADTTNQALKIRKGVIVPRTVSGQPVGRVTLDIYADWDGTHDPVELLTGADANLPGTGTAGADSLWRIHAVVNNATTIYRLGPWALDFGIQVQRVMGASLYPISTTLQRFAPTATFSTGDLATALTASGLAGAVAGAAGLKFLLAPFVDGGYGFSATGGLALVLRGSSAVWYPTTIDLGPGLTSVNYAALGVGGTTVSAANAPLALSTGVALPVDSAAAGIFQRDVAYDGTTVLRPRSGTFNFGIGYQPQTTNNVWPTHALLMTRAIGAELVVDDQTYLASVLDNTVQELSGNGFVQYFRRLTDDGPGYGDAETQHVKLTIPEGDVEPTNVRGSHQGLSEPGIRVTAVDRSADGTIASISTGVAIA